MQCSKESLSFGTNNEQESCRFRPRIPEGMGDSPREQDSIPGARVKSSHPELESQLSLDNVPCFVLSAVDMQRNPMWRGIADSCPRPELMDREGGLLGTERLTQERTLPDHDFRHFLREAQTRYGGFGGPTSCRQVAPASLLIFSGL